MRQLCLTMFFSTSFSETLYAMKKDMQLSLLLPLFEFYTPLEITISDNVSYPHLIYPIVRLQTLLSALNKNKRFEWEDALSQERLMGYLAAQADELMPQYKRGLSKTQNGTRTLELTENDALNVLNVMQNTNETLLFTGKILYCHRGCSQAILGYPTRSSSMDTYLYARIMLLHLSNYTLAVVVDEPHFFAASMDGNEMSKITATGSVFVSLPTEVPPIAPTVLVSEFFAERKAGREILFCLSLENTTFSDRIYWNKTYDEFNDNFHVIGQDNIGAGTFGTVTQAWQFQNNDGPLHACAIKFQPACVSSYRALKRMGIEIEIMMQLDHPHVLKGMGVYIDTSTVPSMDERTDWSPESLGSARMVMPLALRGDTRSIVGKLSVLEIRDFVHQVTSALHYIHELGYLHRDIKPENIMIMGPSLFALADFGLALKSRTGSGYSGSPRYMAPEMTNELQYGTTYGTSLDVYSLGITFAEIITGVSDFETLEVLLDRPEWPLADIILRMIIQEPTHRITTQEILNHEYFKTPTEGCPKPMGKFTEIDWNEDEL